MTALMALGSPFSFAASAVARRRGCGYAREISSRTTDRLSFHVFSRDAIRTSVLVVASSSICWSAFTAVVRGANIFSLMAISRSAPLDAAFPCARGLVVIAPVSGSTEALREGGLARRTRFRITSCRSVSFFSPLAITMSARIVASSSPRKSACTAAFRNRGAVSVFARSITAVMAVGSPFFASVSEERLRRG